MKPLWVESERAADVVGWPLVVRLVPANVGVVPQYAVPIDGGWALTQGQDNGVGQPNSTDNLIVTWFDKLGKRLETQRVSRGGHGDRAYVRGGELLVQVKGVWRIVTRGGMQTATAPERCVLRGEDNLQGEARLPDGRWLRLYGGSIKTDPAWHRGENAYLQVVDGTKVVGKVSVDHVARDSSGRPIGGRYEPEGVFVADRDGEPWVLVGFAVGQLGNTTMNVYGRPVRLVLTD